MPDLPEHLEQLVEAVEHDDAAARAHGFDDPAQAPKLRCILEAAWEVAAAEPIVDTDPTRLDGKLECAYCSDYDYDQRHLHDCEWRKLTEALSDDPNS